MVMAIKHLQGVVAASREMWATASAAERARRMEEKAWRNLRAGVMWQWQQAGIIEEQRRTQIARAWRRHRAEYTSEEWEVHMKDRQAQGEAERERESAAQRKARKKAQAQAHGEGRRLMPSTEEGVKRKRSTKSGERWGGWSILGTLIRYKKGQLREQRMRENNASGTDKEGSGEDAQQRETDKTGGEQTVVTGEGVRSDASTRIQQDTGGQSSRAESGNVGESGSEDTGSEEKEEVRRAQAESTQRAREEEGIMTQEELEEVGRARCAPHSSHTHPPNNQQV